MYCAAQSHSSRGGISLNHRCVTAVAALCVMLTITTHSLAQTIDPPDYLKLLLNDLMRGDENAFTVAFERVSERSERQLYSERDTYYIVLALHQRARASEELRPQIITLLGQIGAKESVYELTEWARTGTRDVRLSALKRSAGWGSRNDALLRWRISAMTSRWCSCVSMR